MIIDLNRFTQTKKVITPIINNTGEYQGRVIHLTIEDGWYVLRLGNIVELVRKATLLEINQALAKKPSRLYYAIGEEGVPVSFDWMKKAELDYSVKINFMSRKPIFTPIQAVLWEDNNIYYYRDKPLFQRDVITQIRQALEDKQSIKDMKKVTPELRYAFMVVSLQIGLYQSLKELSRFSFDKEKQAEVKALYKDQLEDVLKRAIDQSGGEFIKYTKEGSGYLVTWRIGGQKVKSMIGDDLRILNAGFCLSGDDKKHTINSIVHLAKIFQREEGRQLYITRS